MSKVEKIKKKSKESAKESTNENNDSKERENGEELFKIDMTPPSQQDLYSNESDKYDRELKNRKKFNSQI